MQSRWLMGSLALAASVAVGSAQAGLKYRIQDLGTLQGGTETLGATAINNAGAVVGYSVSTGGAYLPRAAAFVWEKGSMRALAPYGTWMPYYTVQDVNESGVAVGSEVNQRLRSQWATLYRDGKPVTLTGVLGNKSYAAAINDAGMVVGGVDNKAFFYDGVSSRIIPIGHPTQTVRAVDINNHGLVLGSALGGKNTFNFIWDGEKYTKLPQIADDRFFTPVGFNDEGAIIGTASIRRADHYETRAYLYANGRYQPIGDAGRAADYLSPYGINANNWVVGTTRPEGATTTNAYLWRNGEAVDLNSLIAGNSSSWYLSGARDINDRGQIVGTGIFNGETRAYLATPVPEPGSWVLMVAGLGAVGWRLRRRAAPPSARGAAAVA